MSVLKQVVASSALHETVEGTTDDMSPLASLRVLIDAFHRAGVRYCAWKSNSHLTAALAGHTDLDLLVDPQHAERFRSLVATHGVRRLDPSPGGAHPGIEHYLGMDADTGRLFHLHVHYRLILGERHVKNYRLPMESQFLESVRRLSGVAVPSPDVELTVLAMRALLKYRARDVVKDVLGIRTLGIPATTRSEMAWLLGQTSLEAVRDVVRSGTTKVPEDLLATFLQIATEDPRSGIRLLRLRARLRKSLRSHARRSRVGVLVESLRVTWARRERLRRGHGRRRMTPATGGTTFAVIGADGAGKSTICADLASWLGWKLDVGVVYLGSKDPTRRTIWTHLVFRALRRAHRRLSAGGRVPDAMSRFVGRARDAVLAFHCLSVARDRFQRQQAAAATALRGGVVIFDRFPVEPLTGRAAHRILDGPRIATRVGTASRLLRALARWEEGVYGRFTPPGSVLVLHVSPHVAAERKPDHDPTVLEVKAAVARDVAATSDAVGVRVHALPADGPLHEVRLAVQKELWYAL